MRNNTIYLDHGATTPVHPAVLKAMSPYWNGIYGNPSSHHHTGYNAARAVEEARETIADLLGTQPGTIIFTGCGSESNNLALRGVMLSARANGRGNHLITSAIEHSAVLETARQLRDYYGFDLTILPVDEYGRVRINDVESALRPDTALISVMAANNEIGTLQPWQAIGELARSRWIVYHSDAVQLVSMRRWNLAQEPVDLMTIAPHKFYGPKGIGILVRQSDVDLVPSQSGGGHEGGLRAGTLNVPLIVGAAEALRLATNELEQRRAHVLALRDRLMSGLTEAMPEICIITGHPTERLAHNASFAFRHVSGNDLLMHLDMAGIAASSGSACSSGDPKPSTVLQSLGLGPAWTTGGLRLTIGLQNTSEEIDYVIEKLPIIIERLSTVEAGFAAASS
ncbi:MAG: cysteine desulfurase [Candidatus Promineofilum sp.]|nr:cysteine desulfurase [Promineifilum sp.]MBP9656887.1 cysteine desulfurase [Promineifilum sp.]